MIRRLRTDTQREMRMMNQASMLILPDQYDYGKDEVFVCGMLC